MAAQTVKLNQQQLAQKLQISAARVSQLKAQGMPVHSVAAARAWRNANLDPLASLNYELAQFGKLPAAPKDDAALLLAARRRREEAAAQLAELALGRERGTLHDHKACLAGLQQHFSNAKRRLLAIPTRAAAEVPPAMRVVVAEIVERLVYEALHELGGSSDAEKG